MRVAVDLHIEFSRRLRFNIKCAVTAEHFKWSAPTLWLRGLRS
jgi:hypothetical protein